MTRDDIIEMAREAGCGLDGNEVVEIWVLVYANLERFYQLAYAAGAAHEREECAKVLDEMALQDKKSNYYQVAAKAIRARGA